MQSCRPPETLRPVVLEVPRSPSYIAVRAESNLEHLTKGERRMMHALLDREDGDEPLVDPKHAEQIIAHLIDLGFIEVKVTPKGRSFMRETF